MTRVKENLEKIKELQNQKEKIDKEISGIKEEINDEYLDYLQELIEGEGEKYIYSSSDKEYWHIGKFLYWSWNGKKDAKRQPGYSNDYDMVVELIDGFRVKPSEQNDHGFKINEKCISREVDTVHQDGNLYLKYGYDYKEITKEKYEAEREKAENAYIYNTTEATYEDLHIGDKITYMWNQRGPYTGTISMIAGKMVYCKEDRWIGHMASKVIKIG